MPSIVSVPAAVIVSSIALLGTSVPVGDSQDCAIQTACAAAAPTPATTSAKRTESRSPLPQTQRRTRPTTRDRRPQTRNDAGQLFLLLLLQRSRHTPAR